MSGPAKTPPEHLAARGSWRGKRDTGAATASTPSPPAWLSAAALECWGEIAPDVERAGSAGAGDGLALAMLADAVAQYRAACAEIEASGLVLQAERGPVRNPAVGIRDCAWVRVLRGCREFGLTPVSRSSAPAALESNPDEDRFFDK